MKQGFAVFFAFISTLTILPAQAAQLCGNQHAGAVPVGTVLRLAADVTFAPNEPAVALVNNEHIRCYLGTNVLFERDWSKPLVIKARDFTITQTLWSLAGLPAWGSAAFYVNDPVIDSISCTTVDEDDWLSIDYFQAHTAESPLSLLYKPGRTPDCAHASP